MSITRKATPTVEAQARQLDRDYARTLSRIAALRRRAAIRERIQASGESCIDKNCNQEVITGDLSVSSEICGSKEELSNSNPMMAKKRFRAFEQKENALDESIRPKNIPAIPTVSTLKDIIGHLDALANYCERNGEKQLAAKIDVISNTLELEDEE